MRDWYMGCALAFQASETSSNLVSRSNSMRCIMVTVWFIILVILGVDGKVHARLTWSSVPEYNTEAECNKSGQLLIDDMQKKIGTEKYKVYYLCSGIPLSELDKLDKGI